MYDPSAFLYTFEAQICLYIYHYAYILSNRDTTILILVVMNIDSPITTPNIQLTELLLNIEKVISRFENSTMYSNTEADMCC